jgi:hypothetical protein
MPPSSSSKSLAAGKGKGSGGNKKTSDKQKLLEKRVKKDKPAKKDKGVSEGKQSGRQGLVRVPGMCHEKFSLSSYVARLLDTLGCKPDLNCRPFRLATACSGSGAPTLVLKSMVTTAELIASEINIAAAHACLINAAPEHCQDDVHAQAGSSKCYCYVCNRTCPVLNQSSDVQLFVAGFPCNSNSLMKTGRFEQDATTTSDAMVFQSVAKLVNQYKPQVAVLENVNGVNCQRGGNGESSQAPVKDWVMQQLKEVAGDDYQWEQVSMTSLQLFAT